MTDGPETQSGHYDVVIIGAGISGIDAAYHLRKQHPGARVLILEAMDDLGGTWRTHRFPGIRSDSDLFTFGFGWKPWTGAAIASGAEILRYLNEAVDDNDLRRHIRFGRSLRAASWSQDTRRWTLDVRQAGSDAPEPVTCGFLWMCAGYYRHDRGHTPDWPDMQAFRGRIVHPQTWPDDIDIAGKRIVVIGSGATAATLIPALAETAAHVTMLQRSPTYYYPRPATDDFTETLRALKLPPEWFHEIMRRKFLHEQRVTVRRSFAEPQVLAAELIGAARSYLGEDFDVETHFTPSYRPWRQRIAVVPDGDLFRAIGEGRASVETDVIERFTSDGLRLGSGRDLPADIIVTATGLDLNALGDVALEVDGEPVDPGQCWTHRGIMMTGVPNLAMVFGYLRTSWTMRADLVSDYVCRLLSFMETAGAKQVTPQLRPQDSEMPARPWVDPENFNAGYILRGLHLMPRQGDRQPWLMTQDYYSDRRSLPNARFDDGTLIFR